MLPSKWPQLGQQPHAYVQHQTIEQESGNNVMQLHFDYEHKNH